MTKRSAKTPSSWSYLGETTAVFWSSKDESMKKAIAAMMMAGVMLSACGAAKDGDSAVRVTTSLPGTSSTTVAATSFQLDTTAPVHDVALPDGRIIENFSCVDAFDICSQPVLVVQDRASTKLWLATGTRPAYTLTESVDLGTLTLDQIATAGGLFANAGADCSKHYAGIYEMNANGKGGKAIRVYDYSGGRLVDVTAVSTYELLDECGA
jgi:hypothetical protein